MRLVRHVGSEAAPLFFVSQWSPPLPALALLSGVERYQNIRSWCPCEDSLGPLAPASCTEAIMKDVGVVFRYY